MHVPPVLHVVAVPLAPCWLNDRSTTAQPFGVTRLKGCPQPAPLCAAPPACTLGRRPYTAINTIFSDNSSLKLGGGGCTYDGSGLSRRHRH